MNDRQKNILIVLDESNEVLKRGIRLAQDEQARVTVLKVVPPSSGVLPKGVLDDAAAISAAVRTMAGSEGASISTRVLAGNATDRIVEVAKEEQCDLILMGTRKKKGIVSGFFGDRRLRKVLDRVTCPVCVVGLSCERMADQAPHFKAWGTKHLTEEIL